MESAKISSLSRNSPVTLSRISTPSALNFSCAVLLPSAASPTVLVILAMLLVMVSTGVSIKLAAYVHFCSWSAAMPVCWLVVSTSSAMLPALLLSSNPFFAACRANSPMSLSAVPAAFTAVIKAPLIAPATFRIPARKATPMAATTSAVSASKSAIAWVFFFNSASALAISAFASFSTS